jgi:WD40 repeat protein
VRGIAGGGPIPEELLILRQLLDAWRVEFARAGETADVWLRSLLPPPFLESSPFLNLAGHVATPTHLAYSSDGKSLLSLASGAGELMVWDTSNGDMTFHYRFPDARAGSLLHGGDLMLVGDADVVRLMDTRTLTCIRTYKLPPQAIGSDPVACRDGRYVAFRGREAADLFLYRDDDPSPFLRIPGPGELLGCAISNDGNTLAVGYWQADTIRLIDIRTGSIKSRLFFHRPLSVALSGDAALLASARGDSVSVWAVADEKLVCELSTDLARGIEAIAFSPCGQFLAAGTRSGRLFVWSIATQELMFNEEAHEQNVACVIFSEDGNWLASSAFDHIATCAWRARESAYGSGGGLPDLVQHGDKISRIRLARGSGEVVSSGWDGRVIAWDVRSGKSREIHHDDRSFIMDIDICELMHSCFVAHGDGVTELEMGTGEILGSYPDPDSATTAVASSKSGEIIAYASRMAGELGGYQLCRIHLVEVATASRVITFEDRVDYIFRLSFSDDGKYLASVAHGGLISIWLVQDALDAATEYAVRMANSTDAMDDGSLGLRLARLEGFDRSIQEVRFSSSNEAIAIRGNDVWLVDWKTDGRKRVVEGSPSLDSIFSPQRLVPLVVVPDSDHMQTEVRTGNGMSVGWISRLLESIEVDPDRQVIVGSASRFLYCYEVCPTREKGTQLAP